jgi:hypothetical protein
VTKWEKLQDEEISICNCVMQALTFIQYSGLSFVIKRDKTYYICLSLLNPIRRNWFLISLLATIVEIGLRKSYAESESGANLVICNVY